MPKLIGNNPNQVSTNGMLGNMAFQNREAVSVGTLVTSGNVGIGATSSSERLVIGAGNILLDNNQGIQFKNSTGTAESVVSISAANNVSIASPTASGSIQYAVRSSTGAHQFITSGAERMRIENNGNVGIGITTPDVRLRVAAASPTNGIIETVSATGSTGAQINFGQSSVADWVIGQPAGVNAFAFWVNRNISASGTELMRLDSSGNLGIGITPTAKLHVASGNAILGTAVGNTTIVPDQTALEYTTDTLPTIRPTLLLDFVNTSVLDSRITFTRSSTGTYYDGRTTAKAEENLLTYSQEFDNANWAKYQTTVTANSVAAPDGTTTAETLADTAVSNIHYTYRNVASLSPAGKTYTVSVFAKANTLNYVTVGLDDISSGTLYAVAVFNLATGALVTTGAAGTGYSVSSTSITSFGNGWYRCTVTCVVGSSASFLSAIVATNKTGAITSASGGMESYLGDGSSIYIWGAQLEERSVATAYTATTASPITNYIPVLRTASTNVPRFDYDPVTQTPRGLLIEEQRTNLLLYSQQFDNAWWIDSVSGTGIAPVRTANAAIAPDGTMTADQIVFNTGAGTTTSDRSILSSTGVAVTASTVYTSGVYIKGAAGTKIVYRGAAGSSYVTATLTGGWDRIGTTETSVATSASLEIGLRQGVPGTINSTATVFLWGAQLEAGAFATSYIPTVASQVTRSADVATMTGTNFSNWYRQDQGVMVCEFSLNGVTSGGGVSNVWVLSASANPSTDFTRLREGTIISGGDVEMFAGGVSQVDTNSFAVTANATTKTAFAWAINSGRLAANGTLVVGEDTSVTPPTVNQLVLSGANKCLRRITYYPQRLSDTTLQGMTR